MSAATAQFGMFAAKALHRPAQSLVRCSRQQYLRLRASETPAARPVAWRSFGTGQRLLAKRYTEDHEWIDVSSPDAATIGISNYAAKALGDVVYVELPEVDAEVNKGDTIGSVESVKSASDIMTPVTGTIVEVNSSLEETPGGLNKSPEGDGWLAKIKVSDLSEVESLMDEKAYVAFTEEVDKKD